MAPVKTILMPIFNGLRARNFFLTDTYPALVRDKRVRLVILVPAHKLNFYRSTYVEPNVIFEAWKDTVEPRLGRILNTIAFNMLSTGTIRAKQWAAYIANRNYPKYLLRRFFTMTCGNRKTLRAFIRWLDRFVPQNSEITAFIDRYQPDLVIAPDIILPSDRMVLRAAKRKRVPVLGMMRSWDNLTAKGVIQILPDKLISQTTAMKREAVRYADMRERDIVVLGAPQFDPYFRPPKISREEFFKQLGIPAGSRLVLCAPFFAEYTNASAMKIVEGLFAAINRKALPSNTHLLIRYRPESRDAESLGEKWVSSPQATIVMPYSHSFKIGERRYDFEFSKEDVDLLTHSLYFSEVTINTISTLSIDAAALDKPVINIRFDGDPDCPPKARVALFAERDHYRELERLGGVRLAYSMEELIAHINAYLKNPALDREGREKIRRAQVEFFDGQSGKRVAEYILGVLFSGEKER